MKQAFKILDSEKTEVVKNSEWLKPLQLADILNLTSRFTVARMLERDDFKKRFNGNISIAIMEFLYPIMQAYDSVAINSDIELGGTDQRFNLLVGRELQKDLGQRQQIAITMPLLVGLDGVNKMSKSLGNYIGVTEKPDEIFGKVMSIPDNIMISYYRLLTRLSKDEIDTIEKQITVKGENPVFTKRNLAKIIIKTLYDENQAAEAEEHFDVIFKEKKAPDEIVEFCISRQDVVEGRISVVNLLVKSGLAESNTAAKNLILQGAIKAADVKITDIGFSFNAADLNGLVIQKGKRFFRKIKA
jgi:tyrosyl-tRNA synthetase